MISNLNSKPKLVNSISASAEILQILKGGFCRISDISIELGIHKSTIHRILKSLVFVGLVQQDLVTKKYGLGYLVFNLASNPMIAHQRLVMCAYEEMKRLRDLSNETVALHVRVGVERMCLEEIPSLQTLKYEIGKGSISPIYLGSLGKAILSELTEEELRIVLNNIKLVPFTKATITSKKDLIEEVNKSKIAGYALSFGERFPHSASIAVPVKNYMQEAAISICGPDNRLLDPVMYAKEMIITASKIMEKYTRN